MAAVSSDLLNELVGIPVMLNDRKVLLAVKRLSDKPWHRRRGYRARINKKWLKRYGRSLQPLMPDGQYFVINNRLGGPLLVMSSTTLRQLKAAADALPR